MSELLVEQPGSERWTAAWEATGREPFAHPEFGGLFAGPGERAVAVCWQGADGTVLLPLVLRELPVRARELLDSDGHDAVSPYGYGGPYLSGQPDLAAFYRDLLGWMRDTDVLSCFVRGSVVGPVSGDPEPAGVRSVAVAENVVVDLRPSAEDRWRRYEHKVRKNVNKARRNGLATTVSGELGDPVEFAEVYGGTMDRRSASAFYRFDADFFRRLTGALPGSFWVADTRDPDGLLVSTELVLTGDRHCYSFLGGTRREAFPMSPNDLLKHDVIEHAADAGLSAYVLGGGYAPGDGIFRYKRAFDPTGVVPFVGVQVVADRARYEVACDGADADSSFFPLYRAPA